MIGMFGYCVKELNMSIYCCIEWWPDTSRRQPQQSDAFSTFCLTAQRLSSSENLSICHFHTWFPRVIQPLPYGQPSSDRIHEIFTPYFSTGLPEQTRSRIENLHGFPKIENPGSESERIPLGPMDGLLAHDQAWIEGEVEYKGCAANRLVYVVLWEIVKTERLYKQTQWWFPKGLDGVIYEQAGTILRDGHVYLALPYQTERMLKMQVDCTAITNSHPPPPTAASTSNTASP
jgi:hypothetical protein